MIDSFMVVDSHPLGWGYDSQTGTNTNGSCLTDWGVEVQAHNAYMNVYYDWSGSKDEATTDITANLTGDADFDAISGELSASYTGAFETTQAEEALTIAVKIRTVTADVHTDFEPNGRDQEQLEAGAFADFLQNCGDRYISRKEMGGYIYLVAAKENLSESTKHDLSGDLDVEFSDISAGFDGMAVIMDKLTQHNFDVRMAVFGFPEIIERFNAQPGEEVQDPQDIFTFLEEDLRQKWEEEAANDDWPGQHYGGVIDQTMKPYKETFYEDCTHSEPGEILWCYNNFFTKTQSHVPEYQRWLMIIDTRLNTQGEYFWGRTTAEAQNNKDAHSRASDVISSCLSRIESLTGHCGQIANSTSATESDICQACDPNVLYHDGTPAEKCSKRNLGDLYEALPGVVPTHDATDYGAQLVSKSQHEPSNAIQPTNTHMCVLGGVKGKMSGSGETVRIFDNGGQWYFAVGSQQGDDDGETLRARAFCSLTSNFFDTNGSQWSTMPDISVTSPAGDATFPFLDGSNNALDDKYATVINGMSGKFQGGGESVTIDRAKMALTASTQQTDVTAYGSAFGLDAPVGDTIERGTWSSYFVGTNSNPSKKYAREGMIPTDDGICYFRKISGDFDGGGEGVRILKKDGRWVLRAKGACKDHDGLFGGGACNDRKNVQAVASCYLYDQTN